MPPVGWFAARIFAKHGTISHAKFELTLNGCCVMDLRRNQAIHYHYKSISFDGHNH